MSEKPTSRAPVARVGVTVMLLIARSPAPPRVASTRRRRRPVSPELMTKLPVVRR